MIDLKLRYTLREYARLTGQTVAAVRKQAQRGTIRTHREGKMHVIYLSQIQDENPTKWAAILELDRVKNRDTR